MNSGGHDYHFDYGKKGYLNLSQDEALFPGVLYDTQSPFELNPTQSGYIGEIYKPKLLFIFKSQGDWTPEQHDVNCITPAIAAAREFITRCQNATDLFDSIDVIGDGQQFINAFDVNGSGVIIEFKIKLRTNASVCVS
jgi:hypothetical protein